MTEMIIWNKNIKKYFKILIKNLENLFHFFKKKFILWENYNNPSKYHSFLNYLLNYYSLRLTYLNYVLVAVPSLNQFRMLIWKEFILVCYT